MIESLLRAFGLRTGLFTSPHLSTPASGSASTASRSRPSGCCDTWEEIAPVRRASSTRNSAADGGVPLSYFEVMTALAFAAFADAPVDVAIVEVGLGGGGTRRTSPTASSPSSPRSGSTTATTSATRSRDIAREKAGIIKPGAIAVVAQQELAAAEVLLERAVEVDAVVAREGLEFGVVGARRWPSAARCSSLKGLNAQYDEVFLPLFGEHQAHNAAVALAAVEAFLGGVGPLDPDLVRAGFAHGHVSRAGSRSCAAARRSSSTPRTTRTARRRWRGDQDSFDFTVAGGRRRRAGRQGRARGAAALEPASTAWSSREPSSPRALDADVLAALAEEVFGDGPGLRRARPARRPRPRDRAGRGVGRVRRRRASSSRARSSSWGTPAECWVASAPPE